MLKRLLNVIEVELSKTNKSDMFQLKLFISKEDAEKYGLDLPKTRKKGIVPRVTNADIMREILEIKSDVKDMKNTPTMKAELAGKEYKPSWAQELIDNSKK